MLACCIQSIVCLSFSDDLLSQVTSKNPCEFSQYSEDAACTHLSSHALCKWFYLRMAIQHRKAPSILSVQVAVAQCFQTSCISPLQCALDILIVCIHSGNETRFSHPSHRYLNPKTMQSGEMLVPVAQHVFLAKFLKKKLLQ